MLNQGQFSSDKLETVFAINNPVFLIVNLDISTQPGTHWIALRIGKRSIEIFDSLGFDFSQWLTYPTHLFKFLNRYSHSHTFYISPIL